MGEGVGELEFANGLHKPLNRPVNGGRGTATVHVITWTFNMNKANTKHWFISPHNLGHFQQSSVPGAQISRESFVPMVTV